MLQQAPLRFIGVDRVMSQVIAVVLRAGLDAVLVAVELMLERRALRALSMSSTRRPG